MHPRAMIINARADDPVPIIIVILEPRSMIDASRGMNDVTATCACRLALDGELAEVI
jgi:hypothetical protein